MAGKAVAAAFPAVSMFGDGTKGRGSDGEVQEQFQAES